MIWRAATWTQEYLETLTHPKRRKRNAYPKMLATLGDHIRALGRYRGQRA